MDWFAAESPNVNTAYKHEHWKVVIVDDDREVHKATKLALYDFKFEGKPLEFISVFSGKEAKILLEKENHIALILLDVVMESKYAGFSAVKYIRDTLNNHDTRIILRTGKIKFSPINNVIETYDIDGYIVKTETEKHLLQHQFYIALRSYRDLIYIKNYQNGLMAMIEKYTYLNDIQDIKVLTQGLILQLRHLFCADSAKLIIEINTMTKPLLADNGTDDLFIIDENESKSINAKKTTVVVTPYIKLTKNCFLNQKDHIASPLSAYYFNSAEGINSVFIIKSLGADSTQGLSILQHLMSALLRKIERLCLEQRRGNS